MSPLVWLLVAIAVLGVVVLSALSGVAASVAYQTLSARGERARFDAELDPVRDDVEALRDSFTRWRTRSAKRVRDEKEEGPELWDPRRVPETSEERAAVKDRLRHMQRGR